MTRARRRRPSAISMSMPWTKWEDDKLREITAVGLSSDNWSTALPRRTFGEIAARRLDLGLKPARLI